MTEPRQDARADWHLTLDEARATPVPEGKRSALLMQHGSMHVHLYAPRGRDDQQPHEQDEIYVIASGEGWFVNGDDRHRFGTGDVLFVPAGRIHRFEEFSADFSTWVVFYGPAGGESPNPESSGARQ